MDGCRDGKQWPKKRERGSVQAWDLTTVSIYIGIYFVHLMYDTEQVWEIIAEELDLTKNGES